MCTITKQIVKIIKLNLNEKGIIPVIPPINIAPVVIYRMVDKVLLRKWLWNCICTFEPVDDATPTIAAIIVAIQTGTIMFVGLVDPSELLIAITVVGIN